MTEEGKRKRCFPLESNPEVMNTYVEKMGFPTSSFSFCDVLSTEEWALAMVPTPVVAVIMLFPIKPHVRRLKQYHNKVKAHDQDVNDFMCCIDADRGSGQARGCKDRERRTGRVSQRVLHAPNCRYGGTTCQIQVHSKILILVYLYCECCGRKRVRHRGHLACRGQHASPRPARCVLQLCLEFVL